MKKLEEYKDILHKCSKCGLCQNVCPIFKETQNECNLIRGIIIMLRGVIKGELKLKEVEKYLENISLTTSQIYDDILKRRGE